MYEDIRMRTVTVEEGKQIIKGFENKWVYIKNICNISNEDVRQVGFYSKFEIRNINFSSSICIYGKEDADRLIIDEDIIDLVQTTSEKDEIMIVTVGDKKNSIIYIKVYNPNAKNRLQEIIESEKNLIITEGKTDWKHIKAAWEKIGDQNKYSELDFEFFEYEDEVEMGADTLIRVCEYNKLFPSLAKKIFVFDADKPEINKKHEGKTYVDYGNNVYSFVLPVPEFRNDTPNICIENYYTNEDIKRTDRNGYRLFMNSDFDMSSGKLNSNQNVIDINYGKHKKWDENYIIDNDVIKLESENSIDFKNIYEIKKLGKNIALSKGNFANYVLERDECFADINVECFTEIFDVIKEILELPCDGIEYKEKGISEIIEIADGIEITKYENGFSTLKLYVGEADFFDKDDCAPVSIEFNSKNVVIKIENINRGKKYKLELINKDKLISFFRKKEMNINNRIEFYIKNHDGRTKVVEIFKEEIASTIIGIALSNYDEMLKKL